MFKVKSKHFFIILFMLKIVFIAFYKVMFKPFLNQMKEHFNIWLQCIILNMYFEEAEVKEYERKNKTKYKQIHLGTTSKFNKSEKVAVIKIKDLETLLSKPSLEDVKELEATIKELTSEKQNLQHDLQQVENKIKSINEEKSEKIEDANSKIEKANKNVIEAKDKVLEIQKEKEEVIDVKDAEIKELNSKLNNEKDFSKKLLAVINAKDNDIVYLANRGLGSRIINKLPDRIKAIVESSEDVNVNIDNETN